MNRPSYLLFKQCSKCGEILHISKFYKQKDGIYGVRGDCKECNNKRRRKNREDNIEREKQYNKEYHIKNKKRISKKNKKWREENKEYCKEYNIKYCENNPDKTFNHNTKRRFKEGNQGNGITKEQWLEMMNFFEWKCAYSGADLGGKSNKNVRTIDHIIPLDNGGEHEVWNCVPMKKSYNCSKHTKDLLEWYLEQPFFSIERLTKIYEWRIYAYWKYKGDK